MSFAERLSYLMESNNTSTSELARSIGVSRQAIMGWKDGSIPAVDKAIKIANYYGVGLDFFGMESPFQENEDNRVPIVGSIRAGYPIESFEERQGYITSGVQNKGNLFALKVVGDSMMPVVMEGDIIICDRNVSAADNKICAVTIDGESTLKRVKIDSTGVTLLPTNPLYKEIHLSKQKAEQMNFHIDGVLIQMVRNF